MSDLARLPPRIDFPSGYLYLCRPKGRYVIETSGIRTVNNAGNNIEAIENREWLDSLEYVLKTQGPTRARDLLRLIANYGLSEGMKEPFGLLTPYVNTISVSKQPEYPGDLEIEQRLLNAMKWNAMAMVVRANKKEDGIGGHISTYTSIATLFEVAFNHFFRGKGIGADQIYFQGHASPGIYARGFLEGRFNEAQLSNFRRELQDGGGLSSYPHPWLMPEHWEFPTVSMGLGPIMAIYQARFNRYLLNRGLLDREEPYVWAFLGDGEMDEPESLGALTRAAREGLDHLIFVVNCNLQRLDGPVAGNFKIINELEGVFRGAGWRVLKVMWSSEWDELFANDASGDLERRLAHMVDGEMQKLIVEDGAYMREHVFGASESLQKLVSHLPDEALKKLNRGGHDPLKVFAAYHEATKSDGQPTVILAHTVKGYGLGEAAEGKNISHQQKKLDSDQIKAYRDWLDIPIKDKDLADIPFYHPGENSEEIKYLKACRERLGGVVPKRQVKEGNFNVPKPSLFEEFQHGSEGREVSTTMVFVRILSKLLRDKEMGELLVPIVPDEARTFGMEGLFRQFGIYSSVGQKYEPVDAKSLLYYRESEDGQILQEGISEAGAMSSFIAAGTAYATHNVPTIPVFLFYSMFGFQRIGDFVWAAGDMRTRGFLVGGTAGRTTLSGEGLQHQDGHSHLASIAVPNIRAYDPAFAFETAVIVEEGIKQMYERGESVFYYLTVENENYVMPPMPKGAREGILKGMYCFQESKRKKKDADVNLYGSGAILNEALKAKTILEDRFDVSADVWSVTSFPELYRDASATERWNMLHPGERPRKCYIETCIDDRKGVHVIASDYVKALAQTITRWFPKAPLVLGTDGFGRSEGRSELRKFFEVDAHSIALGALYALAREGRIETGTVEKAIKDFNINADKPNPLTV